jgi:hypothetical protein
MSQRPTAAVELKQLARLYRIAARIPDLDPAGLQRVTDRLYEKPLAELSKLELAGLIGTLKAHLKGLIDLEVIFQPARCEPLGAFEPHDQR